MLTAVTRKVSPAIKDCELSFIARQPINLAKARQQHHEYEQVLARAGARVISLPPEPELPDSMFVEDPAVVLDELAIILPLGTESRRAEAASVSKALSSFRKLEYLQLPGLLEGGDVLRIGRKLFVGMSKRSNAEGIRQFAAIVQRCGYEVHSVSVTGCLHLKSAVTSLGRNTLLANRRWFNATPFTGFELIDVASEEPHAANALTVGATLVFPSSFPRTRDRLDSSGFHPVSLDISELQKAEAGLTCSSLIFDAT